jgi:phosphatidylserine decarboxylase
MVLGLFYRTRDDVIVSDDGVIISPCGGKIKKVIFDGDRVIIRVFLNIHDQHAQFYPVSGRVTDVEYKHGEFYPAYFLEKTKYNEKTMTTIETSEGERVKVTQIAGQVARRIVNHAKIGDLVTQGEYFGMIKFSSAVDIEFSLQGWKPLVKEGDKLTPLKTIIATKVNLTDATFP